MKLKIIALILLNCSITTAKDYNDIEIVNAIYKAEGGSKAQYKYGIRSVKYQDEADARRICLNTVRNCRKRFAAQTEYKDFLEFLQSRYCPTKGKLSKAEKKTNVFWLKNVRFYLDKKN